MCQIYARLQVLAGGGPKLILDLPGACFLPEHEPYVSAIFRHILEDPVTLQAAMEAEIRNTLAARGSQANAAEGEFGYIVQKTTALKDSFNNQGFVPNAATI